MTAAVRSLGGAGWQLATKRTAGAGAVILGYHDVVPEEPRHRGDRLTVTADQLRSHIGLLQRFGFTLVSFGELTRDLERAAAQRLAALTFDDALIGVAEVAQPILAELGVPATVFTPTGDPGSQPSWWPGARAILDAEKLAELAATGIEIGSHSVTHRSLGTLDDAALHDELGASRRWLQQVSGQPVDVFAYPYGHHDGRVRSALTDAGYRAACTFLNGRVEGGDDPLRLPRLTMGTHATVPRLAYHLLRRLSSWPDHQIDTVGPTVP